MAAALTDFCLYGLMVRFAGLPPVIANLISRPTGGLVSFLGNKMWTFERRTLAGTRAQALRFLATWICAYAASEILVWLFHDRLGFTPLPAKVSAEAIACSGVFLTHRVWTFAARR